MMSPVDKRIPTLDGWRGIAVSLVMFAHFRYGFFYKGSFADQDWLDLGIHGVGIFFVLSGFLITSRLLDEERIDLKSFYTRRFFRIMPAAWTYLAVIALLGVVFRVRVFQPGEIVSCLTFWRNFHSARSGFTDHFWSLSTEEQFYLVWPVLLLQSRRLAILVAGCGAIALSCFVATWYYSSLLVGCSLAFAMTRPAFRAFIAARSNWIFPACVLLFGVHAACFHKSLPLSESLAVALMLACTVVRPETTAARCLQWAPLATLGVVSYSIYVWQQPLLMGHTHGLGAMVLPAVVFASYRFIEAPCIRLGKKIAIRNSGQIHRQAAGAAAYAPESS
jgi:peptidoglycan/LPS O-acetylase OafA/YrhL